LSWRNKEGNFDAQITRLFEAAQRAQAQACARLFAMVENSPTMDLTVDEVMRRWPTTIRVILESGMGCVGCPIAPFHSVAEACGEHHVNAPSLLRALRQIAADHQAPAVPAE
jgi:hybrid cluster-associated redox disulfide protein